MRRPMRCTSAGSGRKLCPCNGTASRLTPIDCGVWFPCLITTGRQFLLLFNGFLASRLGGFANNGGDSSYGLNLNNGTEIPHWDFSMGHWDWSHGTTLIFVNNSVLLLVVIVAIFQLPTQLLANEKMMGFIELPFMAYYTVLMPCLFVEWLGFTHSTYVLKDAMASLGGIDPNDADPAKAMNKNWVYYTKCVFSCTAVLFAGIFLGKGLAMKQTGATDGEGWEDLPGWAAILVALLFLFIMACAEGLQVSALALAKTKTAEFKKKSPLAYATTQLLYKGRNMNAFLVGRQFFVAMMMILLGRVLGYAGGDGVLVNHDDDTWGDAMGAGFNEWMLQTGFLGSIFAVNVAQLASQVTASIFPVSFINNRILNWLLRVMLCVEASGVCNACYPIMWFMNFALNMKEDPEDDDLVTLAEDVMQRKMSSGIPLTGIELPEEPAVSSRATLV